jgi:predicted SnoaL-like aldol condensation-catalyzing enzyme
MNRHDGSRSLWSVDWRAGAVVLCLASALAIQGCSTDNSSSVGNAPAAATSPTAANKQVVVAFYNAAINDKNFELASSFLGAQYKQHNPTAADGAEGLKSFIEFLKTRYPQQRGEIRQVIAEGDLVALHVHSTRGDGTPGRAIVDIFRLADGKVVEHWDVIQDIPEKAANDNGMF